MHEELWRVQVLRSLGTGRLSCADWSALRYRGQAQKWALVGNKKKNRKTNKQAANRWNKGDNSRM